MNDLSEAKQKKVFSAPLIGYPAVKLNDSKVVDNLKSSEIQTSTLIKYYLRYKPDILFPFMDLSVEAEALGLKINYKDQDSPDVVDHPLKARDDLKNFHFPDVQNEGRFNVFARTVQSLKNETDALISGYVTSPFTLAGLLMGAENLALNTITNPEFCLETIRFCTRVSLSYAKLLQDSGADFVTLLDPTAVLLSPALFNEFAAPFITEIAEELQMLVVLHVCGQTKPLIPEFCKLPVKGLSLDSDVDFPKSAKIIPEDILLIGNIHPVKVMLDMDVEEVYMETSNLLYQMKAIQNFIIATGCDVPSETSLSNIEAFLNAVNDFNLIDRGSRV